MRPSVLLVSHTGEIGGAEAALLRLVDALGGERFRLSAVVFSAGPFPDALADRGVAVQVVDGGGTARMTRAQTAEAGSVLRNVRGAVRLAIRLRQRITTSDADLVVANSLKAAVLCSLAAPLARRPWVWHLHDRLEPDYLPRPVVAALRLIARGARRVVANSAATARSARRLRRTVVAYPGVPAELFDDAGVGDADVLGDAVGIVGRISATKGQREFLQAIEELGDAARGSRFRIVGAALFEDADAEAEVRRLAAGSQRLRHVEWTGWSDDPVAEIRRLRLLVHASPVPEPFGQVLVEAMAVRTPVLATDAGGVPEIVAPTGERVAVAEGADRCAYGILVRPGDAAALAAGIRWALEHPDDMVAMAGAARRAARERFAIERTADVVADAWLSSARRSAGTGGAGRSARKSGGDAEPLVR